MSRPPWWFLALICLAGYILLALWFPLRASYDAAPTADIRSLAPTLGQAGLYAVLLIGLFAANWLASSWASRRSEPFRLQWILLSTAAFSLPLIFAFPINASDVYRYFIRGRIQAVYEANPFETVAADFNDDRYLPLAGEWADVTSPYGPLWELTAGSLVEIAPDDLWLGLLLFKALAAAIHLALCSLIWLNLSCAPPGRRASLTLLWAWNPALLLIFVMDGHNDGLMLFWLLAGYWLISRGRPISGLILALLGPLTKPIGLLAIPYLFIAGWRQAADPKARARFFLATGIGGLAMVWLAFLPFGNPLTLVRRLLVEAGGGGGFSPLALIILFARGLDLDPPVTVFVQAMAALFGIASLWLVWLAWRGRSPLRSAADAFALYIIQAFNFRIWYALWPFPWLILEQGSANQSRRGAFRLYTGALLLLTSQLSVLIYGHLRTSLFGGSQLTAHIIGVPFTLGAPLLLAFLAAYGSEHLRVRRKRK